MLRYAKISLLSVVLIASLFVSTGAQSQLIGDLNADHVVDFKDVQAFSWQWLASYCLLLDCIADMDGVDGVNMADFALLANNWQVVDPHVVISEFMASNNSQPPFDPNDLLDGNGDSSDWIEIYNPTDTTVNLDGWYLTDNKNDLTEWQFPNGLQVKPGEFLIVFASQKTFEDHPTNYPYIDPNGYYHTNFKLDESGDYLALVAADGITIAHQYAPQYPTQLTDISYGLAQHATKLVPTGATASYYVPTDGDAGLGTDWTEVDFDDSAWYTGPTGLGFGSGVGTDVQSQMLNVNASLWIRIEFDLGEIDPALFEAMMLRMKYEDGFVAYLNGQYLTGRNAPGSLLWNSTALSNRPIEDSLVFEEINLMAYLSLLTSGVNVLAIHGLNDHKNDLEFLILPELIVAKNLATPEYFTTATPGTFNISGAMGVVGEVWFSHKRSFYSGPSSGYYNITLSTTTDGAEIRYTLDGSRPTITHGTIYVTPFVINRTRTVRAVAVKPGWLDSNVETHTYIFLSDVIQQSNNPPGIPDTWWGEYGPDYEMDPIVVSAYSSTIKNDLKAVPTLSLAMDVNDWFKSGGQGIYIEGELSERAVSAELIFPDGSEGFQIDCCVMIVGGSSVNRWKMDKLSMRLKFKGEYGPTELRYPLFGDDATDEFDTIVVDASMNNTWPYGGSSSPTAQRERAQYTRDQFVSDIQNAMGGYGTYGRHVHLYLNGLYWGLYWLHERPDEHFAADYFGGDDDDYDVLKHNSSEVIHGTGDNYNEMFSIANAGLASDSQYQLIQQYLDVPNFIDYMIANFYVGNTDWAHQNWYATRGRVDPAGRWRYHSWDAEHCMENLYADVTGKDNSGGPTRLHQELKDNIEYCLLFADHLHRHFFNDGVLTPEGAAALYTVRLNEVDRAVVGESARWGDNQIQEYTYTRYMRDPHWLLQRDWQLNTYIPQRTGIVLNQLKVSLYPDVNAPVFYIDGEYQHGGEVSAGDDLSMDNTNPSGDIYYTTDGSDPREPLTGDPIGTPYAPVTLNKSTHVKARVRDDGTWSALNEAIFAVGPVADYLRITEIMYHPLFTGNLNDPNEEYIELKNIGPDTLNLNLVRFTEGIDFSFPDMELDPNEFVVVVKNQSAFEAQYGTSVNMAGEYTGSLANDGERIKLVDAIGQTILDFEYKDDWRPITDGDGFSLTIINANNGDVSSWSEKDSWRASVYRNGSPGWGDSGILPDPGAVVINEVMSHSNAGPDWIELYNTTDESINIGGWFLSDNDRSEPNLMKYRIADGTTIISNDYLVFYQDTDFNNPGDPGCLVPFGLSENGEEACLSSRLDPNGYLTGYREVEDFGASQTNVSLGRYFKSSTGNFNFVAMDYNTPDANNAYPKVGPVVINEIMYNPPTGNQNEEYIELHNITGAAVTLYRFEGKFTPWKFTDGIDYTFSGSSPFATIPADGYLLVVKDLVAFITRYGIMPSDVPVVDGYSGWLSNAGERLQIGMPGDTDEYDTRYYIRIDRVNYSDGSHPEDCPGGVDLWPIYADGFGYSLARKVAGDYGNDVANWQGTWPPSPGLANP